MVFIHCVFYDFEKKMADLVFLKKGNAAIALPPQFGV
jgi:hypothetical protein